MSWFHNGKIFTLKDVQDHWCGFVYRITAADGRMYIGKKQFWAKKSRPPLKGHKRKRRYRTQSDWQDYYGSSEELLHEIKLSGRENFRREILQICFSKAELNYVELKFQMAEDVLLHPDRYFNRFVGTRIHQAQLTAIKKFDGPLDKLNGANRSRRSKYNLKEKQIGKQETFPDTETL